MTGTEITAAIAEVTTLARTTDTAGATLREELTQWERDEPARRRADPANNAKSPNQIAVDIARDMERKAEQLREVTRAEARTAAQALIAKQDEVNAAYARSLEAVRRVDWPEFVGPLKTNIDTAGIYGGDSLTLAGLRQMAELNARGLAAELREDFAGLSWGDQAQALEGTLAEMRELDAKLEYGRRFAAMREGERLVFTGQTPNFAEHDRAAERRYRLQLRAHVLEKLLSRARPLEGQDAVQHVADEARRQQRLTAIRESLVTDSQRAAEQALKKQIDAMNDEASRARFMLAGIQRSGTATKINTAA